MAKTTKTRAKSKAKTKWRHQECPHTSFIDRVVYIAAIIQPLTTLPQVYSIYSTRVVAGISLLTWVLYLLVGMVFLVYGIKHMLRPIILNQVLWSCLQISVIVGILLYR
ncbi:hypothetical protein CR970_01530 [Candidatus Saccharibacteria bacterium]|nr:MAG: hypothetical protein CR970_01530 [Candidatus Saccharibacteria bacterium]